MKGNILAKLLSVLTVGDLNEAIVKPLGKDTVFYSVDPNKIAVISLFIPEVMAKETSFVNIHKIIEKLRILRDKEALIDIDSRKTMIASDIQEFTLKNLDAAYAPNVPNTPNIYTTIVEVPIREFRLFLSLSDKYSKFFRVHADEAEITFTSIGTSNDTTELKYIRDMLPYFFVKQETQSMYPIDWCLGFIKKCNADTVKIGFSDGGPLKLSTTMHDSDVSLVLAPVVDQI